MHDKIRVLMEETGCDAGQAELALASCGFNLERALKTIEDLLRGVGVVKIRLHAYPKHLFGLICILFDTRQKRLIRARSVVSYNPLVFEIDPGLHWHIFEQKIYTCRLYEGSLQGLTQQIEQDVGSQLSQNLPLFMKAALSGNETELSDMLEDWLSAPLLARYIAINLKIQALAFSQFRRINDPDAAADSQQPAVEAARIKPVQQQEAVPAGAVRDYSPVSLSVELVQDAQSGIRIGSLHAGEVVLCRIVDERDIGQYLARLLGGRRGVELMPVEGLVENIVSSGTRCSLELRLAPGVVGCGTIDESARLALVRRAVPRWAAFPRWLSSVLDLRRRIL